ncbi:MAG: protein IcmL (DotI) [Gammaproteobacteria bacterium]|jgi:intracellular multiplication protein IcmL|nr:protein IcmL (DotI) [Gammaproteobacteria bacterium]
MARVALEHVKERNDFYRDSYRKVMMALLLAIAVVIAQMITIWYLATHRPVPTYFATNAAGGLTELVPLNRPNMSTATIVQWATNAAVAAYTFDFNGYRRQLSETQAQYFTPDGWTSFLKALDTSNILKAVIQDKLIVSAAVTQAPVVKASGIVHGKYTWVIQMPMVVTYQSSAQINSMNYLVTLTIERVSLLDSPQGVGVVAYIAQTQVSTGF